MSTRVPLNCPAYGREISVATGSLYGELAESREEDEEYTTLLEAKPQAAVSHEPGPNRVCRVPCVPS